jgi:hypothetical protein
MTAESINEARARGHERLMSSIMNTLRKREELTEVTEPEWEIIRDGLSVLSICTANYCAEIAFPSCGQHPQLMPRGIANRIRSDYGDDSLANTLRQQQAAAGPKQD